MIILFVLTVIFFVGGTIAFLVSPQMFTNGDAVRSMTDEDLAKFLNDISECSYSEGYGKETGEDPYISPYPATENAWVKWLKEEKTNDPT